MLKINIRKPSLENLYLGFGYFFFLAGAAFLLAKSRTMEITSSPWQVIPPVFFISLGMAIFFLWNLNNNSGSRWSFLNASPLIFLVLNIGNLVYPLGFGFDTFIHQATEKLLVSTGTISPKPLAYVGQYVLAAFFNHLSGINIELIDRLMPSLAAALILPAAIALFAKNIFNKSANSALIIFALPFAILANPTPQALAMVYLLAIIFLWPSVAKNTLPLWQYAILVAAALFVHPLAGIPAAMLLVFAATGKLSGKKIKNAAISLLSFIFCAAYPLAFYLMNLVSANKTTFSWQGISLKLLLPFSYLSQMAFPLDLAYLAGNLSYLLILILGIAGIFIILKRKAGLELLYLAALSVILAVNALLLIGFVRFGNIASYEQNDFALRILQISFYSLMPLALVALSELKLSDAYRKTFAIIAVSCLILSNIYLSFPRSDDYQNASFQNLSRYDIAAVKSIEEKHKGENYVVLANQITSAAAVKEFGLDRNIITSEKETVYFYPIPTGGKLYQFYMPLLNEPGTASIISEVKKFAQTEKVFVIVSLNWKRFDQINKKLAAAAASSYSIEGKIFIYEF